MPGETREGGILNRCQWLGILPLCGLGDDKATRGDEAVRSQRYPLRLGVPSRWTFGGSITLSNCWVNMAAAKNATAGSVSLPVLARSCRIGVGRTKTLPGPT